MNTAFTFNNSANVPVFVDASRWETVNELFCNVRHALLVCGNENDECVLMDCIAAENAASANSADADIAVTNGNAAFINELIRQVGHARAG